jgi:hypothetical protein
MDAIWHRAAFVTIKNHTAGPQLMLPRFVSLSATRNTAGASVSVAPIVTVTPLDWRRDARLVRRGLWNTFPTAITPAPLVIMESDPSEEIWISRPAADVTPGSRLELGFEVIRDVQSPTSVRSLSTKKSPTKVGPLNAIHFKWCIQSV